MIIRFCTYYFLLLLLLGCTEDTRENNLPADYSTVFVTQIDFSNEVKYEITYEENYVKNIVVRFYPNNDNIPTLVDSTLFFYKNEFLDSAIIYRNRKKFLPIKTIDSYAQPIGTFYSTLFGVNSIRDTIRLSYKNDQNKLIQQKSDQIIRVINPNSYSELDLLQTDFMYDEKSRLVTFPLTNQTFQYNNSDNVELHCQNNMCTQYRKYDTRINPFTTINERLGIPYFIEGLSRNNPLVYVNINKKESPELITNHYQYDDKGRPILINGKIRLTYSNP